MRKEGISVISCISACWRVPGARRLLCQPVQRRGCAEAQRLDIKVIFAFSPSQGYQGSGLSRVWGVRCAPGGGCCAGMPAAAAVGRETAAQAGTAPRPRRSAAPRCARPPRWRPAALRPRHSPVRLSTRLAGWPDSQSSSPHNAAHTYTAGHVRSVRMMLQLPC
jgi:hypothetical protein